MIAVAEAQTRILSAVRPLPAETVALAAAHGRVLAEDVRSRRTQPPVDLSAMDGWAVRSADVATVPVSLAIVGEAPAGGAHDGTVGPGEAVRIFTGGPLPRGADCIVIQENTTFDDTKVTILESAEAGLFVRPAGLDFSDREIGIRAGRRLTSRDIGLAAAMNIPWLSVRRRPRVALLATGDELVRSGEPIGPNQIVASNSLSLAALIETAGGEACDLGIARDDRDSLSVMAAGAKGADMLVTIGGASVGDHDLIQDVLGDDGLEVDFWRIAMRPGKPLIFGGIGETPMLGMPGNPVSSMVCGLIFLRPALFRLLGRTDPPLPTLAVPLGVDLDANDQRQDYLRARLIADDHDGWLAMPFGKQDSSMISRLAAADCLIVRAPHAPARRAGDTVTVLPLNDLC